MNLAPEKWIHDQYITWYDPEAYDGRGDVRLSPHAKDAKQFADRVEALKFWQQIPKCRPRRDDGKPNRPLTAFSVWIEPVTSSDQSPTPPKPRRPRQQPAMRRSS
jgi:hypothetical protein